MTPPPLCDIGWDEMADGILRERQYAAATLFSAQLSGPRDLPRQARMMLAPDEVMPGMALEAAVLADMADLLAEGLDRALGLDIHALANAGYRTDMVDAFRDRAIDTLMARQRPDPAVTERVALFVEDELIADRVATRRALRARTATARLRRYGNG